MQGEGSVASVVAAIQDEAATELERLSREGAAALEQLRAEAAPVVVADREQRLAAARRERRERIAQEEWQWRRAVIEQREAWITRVLARGRELLRAGADAALEHLKAEAIAHLPAGSYEVTVAPEGGCIVAVDHVAFDNTFAAREKRFEAEWRRALAARYVC